MQNIGVIGIGNIGLSLVQGLLLSLNTDDNIIIFSKHLDKFKTALLHNNVAIAADENELIEKSNLILVCVRTDQALSLIKNHINSTPRNKAYVFFQAGLSVNEIKENIHPGIEFYRAISNVNVASKNGYTFLLKTPQQKRNNEIIALLSSFGVVNEIESEHDLDVYSVISGCFPALIAEFLREVSTYTYNLGVNEPLGIDLVKSVMVETLINMDVNNMEPEQVIKRVATPGGLTENAIETLRREKILKKAIELFFDSISMKLKGNLS